MCYVKHLETPMNESGPNVLNQSDASEGGASVRRSGFRKKSSPASIDSWWHSIPEAQQVVSSVRTLVTECQSRLAPFGYPETAAWDVVLTASLKPLCSSSSANTWNCRGLLLKRTADFSMVRVSTSREPQATTARCMGSTRATSWTDPGLSAVCLHIQSNKNL